MGQIGDTNQVEITGKIIYGFDGTDAKAVKIGTDRRPIIAQREPFIFRPGTAALASGMVASGSRSGSGTTTTGASTALWWGTEIAYTPLRSGKIDGVSADGVVSGQITIGHKSAAGTVAATVSIRVRNTTGASTATTVALAATAIGNLTTAETFTTWDIPYLKTVADFNQVPFGIQLGIATAVAASACIGRIMESSYIQGEMEPGT